MRARRRSRSAARPTRSSTSPARAHAATETAVGTPQSHSSVPSAAASLPCGRAHRLDRDPARAAGARDVDGVTPAPTSARAACGDSPQPVSLTITGSGEASTSRAIAATRPRKSRSPRSWISSWPGLRWIADRVGADPLARARSRAPAPIAARLHRADVAEQHDVGRDVADLVASRRARGARPSRAASRARARCRRPARRARGRG